MDEIDQILETWFEQWWPDDTPQTSNVNPTPKKKTTFSSDWSDVPF